MAEITEFRNLDVEQAEAVHRSSPAISDACWQKMMAQPMGTNFYRHPSKPGYVTAHDLHQPVFIGFDGSLGKP